MLKKISDMCYTYMRSNTTFTLRRGSVGILGWGECWRLVMTNTTETMLACFVTRDDGHNVFKECHGQKLWTENEAVAAADKMIAEVLQHADKMVADILQQDDMPSEDTSSEICQPVYLKKLHSERYAYMHKNANFIFEYEFDRFGNGSKDWCLHMQSQGVSTELACFVIADGFVIVNGMRENVCHESFSCEGRLWTDEEALDAANKMIETIL